jgi:flagellar motor component MotA
VASAGLAAGLLLGRGARKAWLPLGFLAAALVVASGVVDVLEVLDSSAWEHIGDACAAAAVGVFVGLAVGRVRPVARVVADATSAEVVSR